MENELIKIMKESFLAARSEFDLIPNRREEAFEKWMEKKGQEILESVKYPCSPKIAKRIVLAKNALIQNDYDEAYHQLYMIASPHLDKLDDVWNDLEDLAKQCDEEL